MFRRTILVDVLCVFFGIGTWVCINGLWVELPLLVTSQPEQWTLPSFMSVAICLANIAPVIYSTAKWAAPGVVKEKPVIYFTMAIGCVATLLLGLYWDRTTVIFGAERSTALIVLVFFLAMVDCSSRVLFLPFMATFKEIYLTSYFVGEGLSGFVPSIFALVQGVGGNPDCVRINETTLEPRYPPPRFSVDQFFYLLLAMMILSALSFALLNQNFLVRNALAADSSTNSSAVLLGNQGVQPINYESTSPNSHVSPLLTPSPLPNTPPEQQPSSSGPRDADEGDEETGSIRSVRIMGVTPRLKPKPRFKSPSESELEAQNQPQVLPKQESMSYYLLIIQFFICALANGVFPSIQSYSCLPYGTETYHWAVTLSSMTNPAVCFLDFFLPRPTKSSVTSVTFASLGVAAYVMATAVLSPNPPLQSEATGEILLVLSWILLVGLFTYVRISIAAIFRAGGKEGLFWVGAVTQIGSAIGAIIMFFIVNFTSTYQSFQPCVN